MQRLTLATWNVLHGMRIGASADGAPPALQPDAPALSTAAAALGADVLGLQEVDRGQPRSDHQDQVAVVAGAVGAVASRFVPALAGTPGEVWEPSALDDGSLGAGPLYGVGMVSRLPVRTWHVLRFPAARASMPLYVPGGGLLRVRDEPRVALAAVVERPDGRLLTVATCHLSFVPGVNAWQLRRVCRWLDRLPGPRLLLGDLNLPGRLPGLVSRWSQLARVPTYPSWRPRVQWDHALGSELGELSLVGAQAVRGAVSDHCALRVVLAG